MDQPATPPKVHNAEIAAVQLDGAASPSGSFINSVIGDNPYFAAGFGLMGVGVGLSVLQKGLALSSALLRRRMLVTLEVNNRDKAYGWLLSWMSHQAIPSPGSTTRWARSHELGVETAFEQRSNGSLDAKFMLVAGTGTHYFRYRGAWMRVKRERETRSLQPSITGSMPWETVTLTALSRDRSLFPSLLYEARDLALKDHEGKLAVYVPANLDWQPFGQPRVKRPLSSVVLAAGVSETIESDIKSFLSRKTWYSNRGIPYRRGYLLHGPPGSGKSSFIQALAGSLGYDICLLNLSIRGLTDDRLNVLLSNVPERAFILIEDIDAAFNKRVQTSADGYQSAITFSGFLNALDGVASGEQRIIFMTTNHIEALDPALIRPGRVDLDMLVDDASPTQARQLFVRFYGDGCSMHEQEVVDMGSMLEGIVREESSKNRTISMAALQGLFIRNGPEDALRHCRELFSDKRT